MLERVLSVVRKVCENQSIEPESDLFGLNFIDSLGTVNLLVALEQEFGVYIPITEIDRDESFSPTYIAQLLASKC